MVSTPQVTGPPDRLFGPVRTALYVLIAVAAWWVWRDVDARAARQLAPYLVWVLYATTLNAGDA